MITNKLKHVWRSAWHVHGWLRILEISGKYTKEELHDLETYDDQQLAIEKELRLRYSKEELPKINESIKEFKEEMKEEAKPLRIEFLTKEIARLEKDIQEIEENYRDSLEKKTPKWLCNVTWDLSDPTKKRKLLKRYVFEKQLIENPENIPKHLNYVDNELILQAMETKFGDVLEFNKVGKAPCPFHKEEKPSFTWIKESNRGYCFGCNWKGGIIDFVMNRDGLSFQEAVRFLIS